MSAYTERYRRLKDAGLCVRCAKNDAVGGVNCPFCRDEARAGGRARYRARRKAWRDKGLCGDCGGDIWPATLKKCDTCSRRAAKAQKLIRDKRVAQGRCPRCGKNAPSPGRKYCHSCRATSNVSVRQRRLRGVAARCQLTGRLSVSGRCWDYVPGKGGFAGATVDGAHILAKARCVGKQAKDPSNVIFLTSEAHRLFDGGWITFAYDGRCLVDACLEPEIAKDYIGTRLAGYTYGNDHYMRRHRAWCIGNGFSSVAQCAGFVEERSSC